MPSPLKTVQLPSAQLSYSQLLSFYPLPSWIIRAGTFEIEASNQAATALYGYSAGEWSSLNFLDLFTEQGKVVFFHKARELYAGKTLEHVARHFRKDKTSFVVRIHLSFPGNTNNQFCVATVVPVANEISAMKENEVTGEKNVGDQLKLLAHLVEQTSDILTAADTNYRPITWNAAAEKIYGIPASHAIGNDIRNFISINYPGSNRDEVRNKISRYGEWRGEVYFVRPTDNRTVYLWMCYKALFDDDSSHLGYLISAIDITERKATESKLIESENRFREMADSSPVMIWMSNENNETVYVNQKWFEFTGKDITGDQNGWSFLVHPEDVVKAKSKFHKAFRERKKVTLTYRMLSADGNYKWVQDVSVPRFLADGSFIGYIGSVVDIEDQKQKEKQLLYHATILDNVSDVVVTTDLDYRVISWNSIAEACYEMKEKDAIGRKMTELIDFSFYDISVPQIIQQLADNGTWTGEASFVNSKGETRYFLYSLKGIYDEKNNKLGYLSIGRDITDRKMAEQKMRQSEQFYRTLIANSLDGMILVNAEGTIIFSSASVKNVLGFEPEEITGRNAFEFVHGDDLAWAFQSFQREVVENPEVKFIVVRLRKKSGEWLWCMVRGHNLLANPSINSLVVYFHDDTLRKEASDALKESEKRFRSLIRDLQVGVFLSDKYGNIIMGNAALSKMFSIPEEQLVGRHVFDILSIDMIDEKGQFVPVENRPVMGSIRSKRSVKDVVVGVIHPVTQERCWIMMNADPILDENGEIRHVVCSFMDLTERKKLERKLVEDQVASQKQITKATIEGQEAERREIGKELHDNIGQQLTTIKLFLDIARSTANEPTNEMLGMALKAVSDVINGVRAMSRSLVPSTLQDLGLVESINELTDSFSRTLSTNIEFIYHEFDEQILPDNYKLTLFRIVQEQLNNIIKYAEARKVSIRLCSDPRNTLLEIQDDGRGFDIRTLKKGLGLVNIRNRAELLGGKMELMTSPGHGCLLKVTLPNERFASGDRIVAVD